MKITKVLALVFAGMLVMALAACHSIKKNTAGNTTPPVTAQPPAAPEASITVTPAMVEAGESAELRWNTHNANSITIEGIGTVSASGSRKVSPASSTTWHLTATGTGGTAEARATLSVSIPEKKVPGLTLQQLFDRDVKDVFFSYDQYDIRSQEQSSVASDANFLTQHPEAGLLIEGHCDERGSDTYNMGLGENRAQQVKEALVKLGINGDRIKILSLGKERPFCSSAEDESCWQQNRRAHFVLKNREQAANN